MFTDFFNNEILANVFTTKQETLELKEGERRIVSILFADIQGFTAISEQLDSEQIRNIFDNILKIFTHCIKKYGGYVDKYQGDLVMALFGAKKASEEDTQRAIYCGLEMITQLKRFNEYLSHRSEYNNIVFKLGVRIGINTGHVTTGKVGEEREGDFTVYGDAVNIAARMETNAPINYILLPGETMELVKNDFNFDARGQIIVKGKTNPLSVYTVNSIKENTWRESRSPFIGRRNELNTLLSVYTNLQQQLEVKSKTVKSALIGIKGDAGMGKSRLIQEFLRAQKSIEQVPVSWGMGNASASIQNPYRIFITLIKKYFSISETDSDKQIKLKLQSGIEELINSHSDVGLKKLLKENAIFIGSLLGAKYDDTEINIAGIDLQVQIQLAIRILIESIILRANELGAPFVLIVQDLHWADESSVSVITHLLDSFLQLKSLSVIFILSYRPDYSVDPILSHYPNFQEITLSPLKNKDAIHLIQSIISKHNVSEALKTSILERASGNPFYLEELVSMLNTSKSTDKAREMQLINEFDLSVSGALNNLILSRIDQLDERLKHILQRASVIGRQFHYHTLQAIQAKLTDFTPLENALEELVSHNFIQPDPIEKNTYVFKHIITQEVAYNTILLSNKKILHGLIAGIIEENYNENKSDLLYELAYHYDKAENYTKAVHYLSTSADKAKNEYNNKVALSQFKRLLKYIENDKEQITLKADILNNMAEILIILGQFDWALHNIIQAQEISENISYQKGIAIALNMRGHLHNQKGEFEPAIPYLQRSVEICRRYLDAGSLYRSMSYLNTALWHIGKFDEAMKVLNEKLAIAEKSHDTFEIARTQAELATLYIMQTIELDKVIELYTQYLDVCKKLRRDYSAAIYSGNLGYAYEMKGDYDKAFELFNYRLEYSQKIGNKSGVNLMLMNKGNAYLTLFEYSKALRYLNKSIKGYEEIKSVRNLPTLYVYKASVLNHMKKYPEARKAALKAQQMTKGKVMHYDITHELKAVFLMAEYGTSKNEELLSEIESAISSLTDLKQKALYYYEMWEVAKENKLSNEKIELYRSKFLELSEKLPYLKTHTKTVKTVLDQL